MASPKSASSPPNLEIELSPVIKEAIDSRILEPVNASITSTKDFTPSKVVESICLAPAINGSSLVMKSDKFVPTVGSVEVAPSANPPTIPPTNCPIAVPTICRKFPPSDTSHSTPGICARPPKIASAAAISVTTAVIPATPTKAPGVNAAKPDKISMIPPIIPTPSRASTRVSKSTF